MMRVLLAFMLATFGSVSIAAAQQPSVARPSAPAFLVLPSTTPSDAAPPSPDALSLPMRLSLISSVFPVGQGLITGGCGAKSVAAAGTIFPTQPYTQVRLAPRLVLHGFSDLGCPGDSEAALDAGGGAGLTYATPVRNSLWLVASTGTYIVPPHDKIPSRPTGAGGLDLVVRRHDGGTLSTGLGVLTKGRDNRVMVRGGATF